VTDYSAYWIGRLAKRYNEDGPAGMHNRQHTTSRRAAPLLSDAQQEELRQALSGPGPRRGPLERTHRGRVDDRPAGPTGLTLSRLGLPAAAQAQTASWTPSATPCVGRSGGARDLQKKLKPLLGEVATALPQASVELWAVDEHCIGLKPLLRRAWSPAGPRPTRWCSTASPGYGSSASCIPPRAAPSSTWPRRSASSASKSSWWPLPARWDRAAQADRARARPSGWHTSPTLRVPEHVHLLFLPPYSPKLQPAEHLLGSGGR
jgi:hypothetical protein